MPRGHGGLVVGVLIGAHSLSAQVALQNLTTLDTARDQRRQQVAAENYTIKSGDFRLTAIPSLGLDWNDNINTSHTDPESDFILRPLLRLDMTYPLTQVNLLTVNLGLGYDYYFNHDTYSGWRVQSGSAVSFDIFIQDFVINLHDRMSYTRDPAQEAAVANTADYGNFNNTIGLSATWDLRDVNLYAGYDHLNSLSLTDQFQYQDRATEMLSGRAGFQFHPRVMAGLEGTAAFTRYDEPVLNNNASYSLGGYADWQPGSYFRVQPRAGYVIYQMEQTSKVVLAQDQSTWYASLGVTHQPTDILSYSFSIGHELRPGVQSDVIEDTYVRWNGTWDVIKDVTLTTFLTYEHGEQGDVTIVGTVAETYNWFGGGLGLNYAFTKAASVGVNYRLTLRGSNYANREYSQNLIGLLLTYRTP